MLSLPPSVRVFVCTVPTDMRRSFDGLCAPVETVLVQDPFSGHLFMFVNRRRDKVKILCWDRVAVQGGHLYVLMPQDIFSAPYTLGWATLVESPHLC